MSEITSDWMLTGAVTVMVSMLIWVVRTGISALAKELKSMNNEQKTMNNEQKALNKEIAVHNHRLDGLEDKHKSTTSRLNHHSERIRQIEINKKR